MKVLSQRIKEFYSSVHRLQELDVLYNNQGSESMTGSLVRGIVEL